MRLAALALLVVGCDVPQAITLPLPLGRSLVVDVWEPDECTPAHEAVHQRQIREMGAARFLLRRAWEQISMAEPRCGSIEGPAYAAGLECCRRTYDWESEEQFEAARRWRCP